MYNLTTLEVVSVRPCNILSGCYMVEFETNLNPRVITHVTAKNPYHAVNHQIKELMEAYGTTRSMLNNNNGVQYRDGYDAGWKYLGGGRYRYEEPVEAQPTKPDVIEVFTVVVVNGVEVNRKQLI